MSISPQRKKVQRMLIYYFEAESNTIFGGGFPYMVFTVLNWCDQITNLRIISKKSDLLAPSGDLIAIPTYYWSTTPPPHFFRSHRSSTMYFHFLSHYSCIKAIMLYKGNHWTQCAGFMDAFWVRLGITNDDLGTSWALPGDNLVMTWG